MHFRAALLVALFAYPLAAWADAQPFAVTIEGLGKGSLLRNIQAQLAIRTAVRAQTDEAPLSDRRLRALNRRAEDDIRGALNPFGYYDTEITSDFDLGERRATYTIVTLGPRTVVRDISIRIEGDGKDFQPLKDVRSRLRMQPEEPLRHQRYNADKNSFSLAAFEYGFLDSRFLVSDLWVYPDEQAADIEWRFDTGTRWRFGEISVEADNIDEDVIRRYLTITEDNYFSPRDVLNTQLALSDLGYFAQVDVVPDRDNQSNTHVPMTIRTTPIKDQLYSAGIGYGTDTGARLSLGAEFRRLNRRGHKLRSDIRLSEVQNRAGVEYRIPLGSKNGEFLSFHTGYIDEEFDEGETERYEIGAALTREPGDWSRRTYITYEIEESRLGNQFTDTDLLMPGVSFTRSELDDPIHPRNGWYAFIDVHGASEDVLSTTTFLQSLVQGRFVLPLWDTARLLLRGEYGATLNNELAELPASQRFFAGGDQSVRGYAYRSIGPRDESGENIGGEYMTTLSAEIEQTVWGNLGVAAFLDAGGVDNKPGPALSQGVGAGLRYRAPIGYVNLDLAHPLRRPETGVRLHLGIRVGL
ncbi:autotransporter assembly complex protein TamA [Polycyclovorans algicola]|uniref:autotransporter assembly complex protein TamA n=1 Tax=Polycyclovorans algicola TaxID=616992 RepID=UPI0004A72EC6|nr:autotransporter assembly complex family protein [Polycyclovorans algicola]